ncbi:MAG: hypothetical protein QOF51_220, partial [Chloroflexota bacterium]|nr:hypothetical protein [Chloroflexota bacterium]
MHISLRSLSPRIRTGIGGVLLALLLIPPTGAAFAADSTLLTVDSLGSASVSGAATFHGLAVNCTTSQPASQVAVYDGQDSSGSLLAYVSMDTVRTVPSSCSSTVASSARTGFTLIFDTNKLTNGTHTLAFVATF